MVSRGVLSGGNVVVDMKHKEFTFEVKKKGKSAKVPSTVITEEKVSL